MHLRYTQCSILLHLIDICFLTCICLWQISQIQTCFRVVVGPGLVSTSPAFYEEHCQPSSGSAWLLAQTTVSRPPLMWRPVGMWYDTALSIIVQKIFSSLWLSVGRECLLRAASTSCLYWSKFSFFRLTWVRHRHGLVVVFICNLMRIGRWSELGVDGVCEKHEVMRKADANETSGTIILSRNSVYFYFKLIWLPKVCFLCNLYNHTSSLIILIATYWKYFFCSMPYGSC